ncbi:DEAD/DEAH box helicase [Desulfoferula mesophila]|uniref:DEAD/DEAH box family ATP-dependent RNA helicase n=1 Tax=Desulfoferula mesophila TaxID=3058419 RepID=A0AAU9EJN4_9BACT|nr:DEAD/DEAH box family ATP-dependent RNA helicase [Desulfoferula mesophilus]
MSIESFEEFGLSPQINRALLSLGHQTPTPVQAAAIPAVLEGRDLLGCSQTGTGKTGAFALPILQTLSQSGGRPRRGSARCLVLTPTRELALQIADSFKGYGRNLRLSLAAVYGGVGQMPQVRACARGIDVLVATPGRLLDLIRQGHLSLGNLEILVLDEADRMLDMGFLPDIKRVLAMIPDRRQTLFFSATMPPAIAQLAGSILDRPVKVQITPSAVPVERIAQRVMFATQSEKRALLGQVLGGVDVDRVLVFTRTKHGADRVVRQLAQGGVSAEGIHGNKSQNARQRALANFRSGATRVLVATDIASRGIDVEGVTHVINYDLPNEPECYVHRIGRTARAGADGVAISFCSAEERSCLRAIERLIKRSVPVQGPNAPKDGGGSKKYGKSSRRRPRRTGSARAAA